MNGPACVSPCTRQRAHPLRFARARVYAERLAYTHVRVQLANTTAHSYIDSQTDMCMDMERRPEPQLATHAIGHGPATAGCAHRHVRVPTARSLDQRCGFVRMEVCPDLCMDMCAYICGLDQRCGFVRIDVCIAVCIAVCIDVCIAVCIDM